ncbi:MAG: hypothetical protein FWH36_06570 [Lentimicrobiaceae bacterium]|nr:hypothetical protein [Lentimicrobiaceae bacterium]
MGCLRIVRGYVFFAFCMFFMQNAFCQQDTVWHHTKFYYSDSVVSSEGWIREGKPDRFWISYYPDGTVQSKGNRKNFLLDGTWYFYDNKGDLKSEISYKESRRDGETKIYTENEIQVYHYQEDTIISCKWYSYSDSLVRLIPYENGKENGMCMIYDTLGQLIGTIEYQNGYAVKRENINRMDANGYKQGVWKYFAANGLLYMEGVYLNGKKNGFFKYYNEEGDFERIEKWENDILIEDAVETKQLDRKLEYHPNGKIKIEAYFYKGVPDGIRREYTDDGKVNNSYLFSNGILKGEGIVDDDGKKQGDWKEFYESGALRAAGKYLNSKPIGKWRYYFEEQTIEIEGSYTRKGEKDGEWLWYYPNGNLLSKETYSDGLLDGESFNLTAEGDTLEYGKFTAGLEDERWYYINDSVKTEGNYSEGRKEGVWKVYYASGKLKSLQSYSNNELDGRFVEYWENGVKKQDATYINGLLNGNEYKYDENGNVLFITTFRMGIETKYNGVKVTPQLDVNLE